MKKITLLLLLANLSLFAQQKRNTKTESTIKLTGKIVENDSKQPLEYATVVLTHLKSNEVSGGITDIEGNFSISIPKGDYAVKVEFIGFKTKKLPNQKLEENKNLGTITLKEDSESLDEVEIIAEKSTVEIRLDKKIYNVGKDMTLKGGNASDVLDNVPSVNVDAEGAVSLRGNENVRILIDGKPSALVGLSGTDALRNLPSDAIEKVEVITSPSARYDAEGTAGILNIILRKGKLTGFNGSINTTIGNPDILTIAPNLNYRTKKFNLFSNFGYSYRKGPGNSDIKFSYLNDGIIDSTQIENRVFDRENKNFNASIGIEYYLNKNSSITGSVFFRDSKGNDIATNLTDRFVMEDPTQIIKKENRVETEIEDGIDTQFSLNYTNNFDGEGKKIILDYQYSDSDETELAPITVDGVLTEQNSQITKSKDQLFQADFILPIGENSQFEIGHKTTLQDLYSDFKVRDGNGNPLEYDPSNAIKFQQNIYAFYAQYGNKIDAFSYLLGLRTEITDIDLDVITTNQESNKNYTEWFPTVNLGYEFNETDNLTLGYSRRLQRPRFWFINPFESRSSAYNVFKGNPDIDPTFTSSFDLGYTTKISKLTLNSSLYYQYSTDIIQTVSTVEKREIDGEIEDVFVRQPTNLSNENRYGFEVTANYNPISWARFSTTFNYYRFKIDAFTYVYTANDGEIKTIDFDAVDDNSWFARFNSRITLPGKVQWQTRIMYRGPRVTAQEDRKGMFVTNLSFSKDLFKEKASLVLNVRDLFNSRKRETITYYGGRENPNSIGDGSFQWRERQIALSFTYRFNQKKKREKERGEYGEGGEDFGG
ncbi:outer membrane beta-barrel family protein [Tenacibaculum sp. SG-28]|uniref:outer membrane beta-barrel family protein n=1 Tax=Tenacibaculum sp. SG-28 TaxID=754426 RepID=UPI000CF49DB4|nr:outer membrane beta-barrel family protein [Tenacibaculum sp. SG-28]PQJ23456.1 hypothetical protein BSU00_04565 [Tenacibaculum sp. SG-28]